MELSGYQLTFRQKLMLALNIFIIYWPIRQYVGKDRLDLEIIQRDWLIWIFELIVTVLWFTFFLVATEWLEKQFVKTFKIDFLQELKLPAQITTLALAAMLAVAFNVAFFSIFRFLRMPVQQETAFTRPVSLSPPAQFSRQGSNRNAKIHNGLTVMAMLSAFYLAANKRRQKQIEELRVASERIKLQATQAQLLALQNQINPHFLFNSLNILSSLVEINPKLSIQFINRLAWTFRYILENGNSEKVSLKNELDFLQSYIFLLNIRFEDKLKVSVNVPDALSYQQHIAPLTLQLLVENVVKHNQMSAESPLHVSVYTENGYLVVENQKQLRPESARSTGLGLANIQNRYSLLTDKKVIIEDEETMFVVKIPLI